MSITDIHIKFGDLPAWAKEICRGERLKPLKIKVNVGESAKCGGNWHDANVKRVHFYRDEKVATVGSANGDNYLNCTVLEQAVYDYKFTQTLQPGDMILVTNTYPKKAEIFVHPSAMPKLIK